MTDPHRPIPRVGFLCGKGGGDFRALTRARSRGLVDFRTVAFITSNPDSTALNIHRLELDAIEPVVLHRISADRKAAFSSIEACLAAAAPDWIFLCGFTYLLPSAIVAAWRNRIINTHHASLPEHPGLFTKESLVALGEPELAATVHLVDEGVDTGSILAKAAFPNFGPENFDTILRYYRFAQDVLIVQVFRDLQDRSADMRVDTFHDIRFTPDVDLRVLEACGKDHGFA